ncbi:MAG: Rossmann-like and DUF2520 domain-containing protein [Candidatus Acidiferrales bacterium]
MNRTISIIGAGRVGRTLGRRLRQLGWRIEAVVARSNTRAREAVRWIGAGKPFAQLERDVFASRVLLLTTGDSALAELADNLAHVAAGSLKGKVVLHTSGALDSRVLRPLVRLGAATGSLHPMQTFTGKEPPKLIGIMFAIEGTAAGRRVASQIARELGGQPVVIDPEAKAAYHAAGTFAAGHALAVMETATQILTRAGFGRDRALKALLPLTRQMLDNFEAAGPRAAWTGPLARKDYAIVSAHAEALRRYPREFGDAYAALSLLSARVLAEKPAEAIAKIRRSLRKR